MSLSEVNQETLRAKDLIKILETNPEAYIKVITSDIKRANREEWIAAIEAKPDHFSLYCPLNGGLAE